MYNASISSIPDRELSPEILRQRLRTQDTAQRLSLVAMRHWEKALAGVIALPAAAALSTAAACLFGASIVERVFEVLETTLSDVGRRVGKDFDAQGELAWPRDTRDGKEQRSS